MAGQLKHPPVLPLTVSIRMRLLATTCRTPRRVINTETERQSGEPAPPRRGTLRAGSVVVGSEHVTRYRRGRHDGKKPQNRPQILGNVLPRKPEPARRIGNAFATRFVVVESRSGGEREPRGELSKPGQRGAFKAALIRTAAIFLVLELQIAILLPQRRVGFVEVLRVVENRAKRRAIFVQHPPRLAEGTQRFD